MNILEPINESVLREDLRKIVTRNGKSGRIPAFLEAELDDLETYIDAHLQTQVERAEKVGKLKGELNVLLDLENKMSPGNSWDIKSVVQRRIGKVKPLLKAALTTNSDVQERINVATEKIAKSGLGKLKEMGDLVPPTARLTTNPNGDEHEQD